MTHMDSQTTGAIAASRSIFFFNGNNGYALHGNRVTLHADEINSPEQNSGELSLQLWALDTRFDGEQLIGQRIASLPLGILLYGNYFADIAQEVDAQLPMNGTYHMVLALVETHHEIEYFHDWRGYALQETFGPVSDFENSSKDIIKPTSTIEGPSPSTEAAPKGLVEFNVSVRAKADVLPAKADKQTPAAKPVVKKATAKKVAKKSAVKKAAKKSPKTTTNPAAKANKPAAKSKPVLVSINKASLEAIAALSGVSFKLAESIVASRPYKKKQDLLEVKGVGAKMLETIKPQITL